MLHMPVMSCKLKKQPSSNRSRKIKIEFPDETNQMTFKDWCLPGTNYTVGQFDICSNCLETLVWTGDICLMTKKIWFLRNFCKILLRNSSVYSEWYTLHGIGIYRTWCVLCARRAWRFLRFYSEQSHDYKNGKNMNWCNILRYWETIKNWGIKPALNTHTHIVEIDTKTCFL